MGHASFSADGRTLVSSQMGWIYVWDVESGTMRRKIRHPHGHGCNLTLAPDGRTLATSDLRYSNDLGEDTIRLYDVESGDEFLTLRPRDDRATSWPSRRTGRGSLPASTGERGSSGTSGAAGTRPGRRGEAWTRCHRAHRRGIGLKILN